MWAKLAPEFPQQDWADCWARLRSYPKAYFKSSRIEILGWGSPITEFENIFASELALGCMRFDRLQKTRGPEWSAFGDGVGLIPSKALVRLDGASYLAAGDPREVLADLNSAAEISPVGIFWGARDVPAQGEWDQMHGRALDHFASQALTKLVLSRKRVQKYAHSEFMAESLVSALAPHQQNTFALALNSRQAFVSFTPERLFALSDGVLEIDCLAGTRPRGMNAQEDTRLEHELLDSPKELNEHRQVALALEENLKEVHWQFRERVLKLKHVQHLHSKLLAQTKLSPQELIQALHPTPAVGGRPKEASLQILRKEESAVGFDRGLFAGPVGAVWKGQADFLVGIRSALALADELHIFAGAGIVPGSDSQAEWSETSQKMRNFPSCEEAQ